MKSYTKTSITDPLKIATVTPEGLSGVIGMTLCPGRKGTSMARGKWDRNLDVDLEVVRAWKPDIVLALLEEHEFTTLGIPHFRQAVADAGLPWQFLPIPDGGVPDDAFERTWQTLGPGVRDTLRGGGRVLIHCRAGLGRTGMLAAAILVELGAPPQDAIVAVRAARPNTIETAGQEAFVRVRVALR
ncbi:MAG: cyclin-dependent kinase inhibitor 3 family protein [Candidatus Eremiobacteraeota bacterium]|nr:cyclin-dependent kinase inhibitor 3 family protein [Candidatus Eremiobacteraeota bacterium]